MRSHLKKYLFYIPTASLVIGLIVAGVMIANKPAKEGKVLAAQSVATSNNQDKVPGIGKGLKFGAYTASAHNTEEIEKTLQSELDIVGWYTHWNQPMVNNKLINACKNHYVPSITWESWHGAKAYYASQSADQYPLADIAAGKYDAKIIADLQGVAATCKDNTVLIRFDHEMNVAETWYPWQNNAEAYKAAWKRVVDLGHKHAPNVKWIWAPYTGDPTAKEYYPGGQYVDYVGITLNKRSYSPDSPQSFSKLYELHKVALESFGKPIMIAETGAIEGDGAVRKADWINSVFSYLKNRRQVVGLIWFNETITYTTGETSNYKVDSTPVSLEAFQKNLKELHEQRNK